MLNMILWSKYLSNDINRQARALVGGLNRNKVTERNNRPP